MSGSPDDGDLVAAAPKVAVPEAVAEAVRTLIAWAGDDPGREGLIDTPARVARAWKEYASGYGEDPAAHLARTFDEVGGYDEIVLLKDIPFQSHCEHVGNIADRNDDGFCLGDEAELKRFLCFRQRFGEGVFEV